MGGEDMVPIKFKDVSGYVAWKESALSGVQNPYLSERSTWDMFRGSPRQNLFFFGVQVSLPILGRLTNLCP